MHIPDGFLSTNTWVPAWLIAIGGLSICIKKTNQKLKDKMVPLMGVMAAFIFAAQMINFPVLGGTSGHLLGGVLAAIMVGPWAAAIILSVVLVVQCLVFQDGGLTALGANILNMSFIGTMGGYLIFLLAGKLIGKKKILVACAVASWASVILASCGCALELSLSATAPLHLVLPAMLGVHGVIGIGEAVISCLVLSFVLKTRHDLVGAANA